MIRNSDVEANHPVWFCDDSFGELKALLEQSKPTQLVVLVDDNTLNYCYPKIQPHLPKHHLIEIPSGEEAKNLDTCSIIWKAMTDFALDRKAMMINVGGGVIGDMGGFCAATFKRGITFVQIPTTLLSQVDASVGGKLGIDFMGFKNHIGVFQEPLAVFIHHGFQKTLPSREIRSGFAEMLKHGLIQDRKHWNDLLRIDVRQLLEGNMNRVDCLKTSVAIKADVVAQDPTEKGLRKILNFGHTLGHAIETFYLNTDKRLFHGEAIALGMIAESFIGYRLGNYSESTYQEIKHGLRLFYPEIGIDPKDVESILPLTLQDKKNSAGVVKYSLLLSVGECGYDIEVSPDLVHASLLEILSPEE